MNSLKRKYILIIRILCILFILLCIWICRFTILSTIDSIFSINKISQLNLSEEQKLEDFNYMYNSIIENTLSLENYNNLYGIDFIEKKFEYEELIKNTSSDFEFYVAMKAIIKDIPSFHSDIVYPSMDVYNSLNCYNSRAVSSQIGMTAYTEYWNQLIEKNDSQFDSKNEISFIYTDGKYMYNIFNCCDNAFEDAVLLSVNGDSIEDYLRKNETVQKLHYDFSYDRIYKDIIIFNSISGESVDVEIQLKDGTVITEELYSDIYSNYYINIQKPTDKNKPVYFFEGENVSYLKLDNLNTESCKTASEFLMVQKNSNVILDLRDNYGGMLKNAKEYIFPYLYSSDYEFSNLWYIKDTKQNMKMYDSLYMIFNIHLNHTLGTEFKYSERNDCLYSRLNYKFIGQADLDKNVYVLTSKATGSSADNFVAFLKNNNLAEIIGDNTGGEGLTYSFMSDSMPNSKIVFIFTPGKAFNPDETDNSVYGTSPDIYINQSYSGYKVLNTLDDPYTYENRLKWDNVLIETLEIIKEKENAE